ncbi:DoxX family protein [Mycobacteroides abscessus]|nr:DoxX family protein [Mycobacteroides abscessus]
MAPLIALVVGTLSARLAGILGLAPADSWPAAVAVGLAAMFTLTGPVSATRNPGAELGPGAQKRSVLVYDVPQGTVPKEIDLHSGYNSMGAKVVLG